MTVETPYALCGYIEYFSEGTGFVTPVFRDKQGQYCVQAFGSRTDQCHWTPLPEESHSQVRLYAGALSGSLNTPVYGFRWGKNMIFADGPKMSDFLSYSFMPSNESEQELAQSFIADWSTLEPRRKEVKVTPHRFLLAKRFVRRAMRLPGKSSMLAGYALLATIMFALFIYFMGFWGKENLRDHTSFRVSSPGATIALPDGSTVTLNAGSLISYEDDFGEYDRKLILTGQAYFEVKKDPRRRFIAHSEGMDVVALGTSFDVKAYPEHPELVVTVTEGRVNVESEGNTLALLSAGEQVVMSYDKKVISTKRGHPEEYISSTSEFLTFFDDIPATEAFDRICEEQGIRVVVEGDTLADWLSSKKVSALFSEKESLTFKMSVVTRSLGLGFATKGNTIIIKASRRDLPPLGADRRRR